MKAHLSSSSSSSASDLSTDRWCYLRSGGSFRWAGSFERHGRILLCLALLTGDPTEIHIGRQAVRSVPRYPTLYSSAACTRSDHKGATCLRVPEPWQPTHSLHLLFFVCELTDRSDNACTMGPMGNRTTMDAARQQDLIDLANGRHHAKIHHDCTVLVCSAFLWSALASRNDPTPGLVSRPCSRALSAVVAFRGKTAGKQQIAQARLIINIIIIIITVSCEDTGEM
ncbi:hypothetical protein LX32DRAFT_304361 [Colletotrichum zoysiae]|uniref:Uncharacterized protein n=1 Tax=Colletotrichum zoysiae TaxID=1216348 RepID=A0AAD9LT00_9PEZI|nr:hypothetical protein LX32DRAFT_304361 [Colletotrichum zoysiae]